MPGSSTSVVPVGPKKCKPFLVEVMVFSPEAGYKFELNVEKACSVDNDPIWKVVFDLYEKIGAEFVQIVHVSFRSGTAAETAGVKSMVTNGISQAQADGVIDDVFPATKAIAGDPNPSPEKKQAIHNAMSNAVTAVDV